MIWVRILSAGMTRRRRPPLFFLPTARPRLGLNAVRGVHEYELLRARVLGRPLVAHDRVRAEVAGRDHDRLFRLDGCLLAVRPDPAVVHGPAGAVRREAPSGRHLSVRARCPATGRMLAHVLLSGPDPELARRRRWSGGGRGRWAVRGRWAGRGDWARAR